MKWICGTWRFWLPLPKISLSVLRGQEPCAVIDDLESHVMGLYMSSGKTEVWGCLIELINDVLWSLKFINLPCSFGGIENDISYCLAGTWKVLSAISHPSPAIAYEYPFVISIYNQPSVLLSDIIGTNKMLCRQSMGYWSPHFVKIWYLYGSNYLQNVPFSNVDNRYHFLPSGCITSLRAAAWATPWKWLVPMSAHNLIIPYKCKHL